MSDNSLTKGRHTKLSNKIGLFATSDERTGFLMHNDDVVLRFPFKDTVLEAGMNKEDNKRDERFLHIKTDGRDIDTLFEPKVLTNYQYFSQNDTISNQQSAISNQQSAISNQQSAISNQQSAISNQQSAISNQQSAISNQPSPPLNACQAFFDNNGNLQQNLLIKGNNLLALHSLKERLSGQIKLIYIDPPYNTGSDSFKYNDNFNHSSWLVFMKNRLEVARELLSDDGVIFVSIDDNEQAYLKVLMDEIFGRENFRNIILTRRFDKNINNQFVKNGLKKLNLGVDYLLVYSKNTNFLFNAIYRKTSEDRANFGYWKGFYNNSDRPTMRYEILGVTIDEGQWKWSKKRADEAILNYQEYLNNFSKDLSLEQYWEKTGKTKKFIRKNPNGASSGKNKGIEHWIEPSYGILRNSNWSDILTTETNAIVEFNNPKSENLILEIIKCSTNPNDIVLDYHVGSGTTCAVAHKMGRRWIGIEQMDYIEDITKVRLQKVLDGEQGGISKAVNWQGGGSFVYLELKKYNQYFIDKILQAQTMGDLDVVYNDMAKNAFFKFWFDKDDFQKQYKKDADDKQISLDDRKKILIDVLDENQLYLNYADMDDTRFNVSDDDKALSKAFYGA